MEPSFTLYTIVNSINGGDIEPYGETTHDALAFSRMKNIEHLINRLLADIIRCYGCGDAPEASIQLAADEARQFLEETVEWLNDELDR